MQILLRTPILLLLGAILAHAAEQTAVVNEGKINVRGQPSLIGEVVTQLQRGDEVTVLDFVTNERAKAGEPTNWAKIKLPANTPVWVYGEMLRNGAVSATRLNLRAGPGDNYSVIGRLNRGDRVTTIRSQGDWVEIEAPDIAYAFVDSTLLKLSSQATDAAPTEAPAVAASATTNAATAAIETPSQPQAEPIVSSPHDELAPPIQPPATLEPNVTTSTIATAAPPVLTYTPPETSAFPATVPSTTVTAPSSFNTPGISQPNATITSPSTTTDQTSRRVVRREGIVRPTVSIQAPTWYELVHPQTKRTIGYLYEENLGIKLKPYKGQKVVVTGEEAIDSRWPNTPIIELQSLDIAP
jgi:hypothetical protein